MQPYGTAQERAGRVIVVGSQSATHTEKGQCKATEMQRITGRFLNEKWNVRAKQALYHKDGTWYECLTSFPGALFDPGGYVRFETEEVYLRCPKLSHGKKLNVRGGISSIYGYVRMDHLNDVGEKDS